MLARLTGYLIFALVFVTVGSFLVKWQLAPRDSLAPAFAASLLAFGAYKGWNALLGRLHGRSVSVNR